MHTRTRRGVQKLPIGSARSGPESRVKTHVYAGGGASDGRAEEGCHPLRRGGQSVDQEQRGMRSERTRHSHGRHCGHAMCTHTGAQPRFAGVIAIRRVGRRVIVGPRMRPTRPCIVWRPGLTACGIVLTMLRRHRRLCRVCSTSRGHMHDGCCEHLAEQGAQHDDPAKSEATHSRSLSCSLVFGNPSQDYRAG
jgi:hypothetical protein